MGFDIQNFVEWETGKENFRLIETFAKYDQRYNVIEKEYAFTLIQRKTPKKLTAKLIDSNVSTHLYFSIDKLLDGVMGILKKPNSTSSRDHYFLFGAKVKARVFTKYGKKLDKDFERNNQSWNHQAITGMFVSPDGNGDFKMAYAGNSSVLMQLNFHNKGIDKLKWLIFDHYNILMMKHEYHSKIPFFGIQTEDGRIISQ